MAKVLYLRVSSAQQDFLRQEHLFKEKGIEADRIYKEKLSGKDMERPELKAMLAWVRDGDTVYIESISRIARNTLDFLNIIRELESKQVKLVSLKENIDTSTNVGKFLLSVLASLAQLERETIRERQAESFEARREKGLPIGRPKKAISKSFPAGYKRWKAGEITAVQFMKDEHLSKTTFYKLVKEYEERV